MNNNNSSPTVTDCTFTANTAGFRGGGIFVHDGILSVTNCTFIANLTPLVFNRGGGAIFSSDGQLNLVDCDLHDNVGYHGGAVAFVQFFLEASPSLTLVDCSLTNNSAVVGGGVFNQNGTALLINSTLIGNQVSGDVGLGGGILLLSNSSAVLTNTTISANSASQGGGMWININSSATVTNGILWDNSPDQISGSATASFSNVQDGWPGVGNIDADPVFVDPANGDYRLSPGSPCIDAADNTALPKGVVTDLDGNPRFVDDPATKDTGNGDPPIVDMGAYEFQALLCPWDLDSNGSIDVSDLLLLLGSWGTCPSKAECPADFDGSNNVGVADLLVLLASWGRCP